MNRLKIRKMDSKTKLNLLGTYCSAIGFFNANGLSHGVAETIRCLKELSSLLTRAQRVRDELTDDDITVIGEVRMTKFDGILAIGRLLKAKALYVQSHPGKYIGYPGKYTGYPCYYPNVLRDLKSMLKFSGKTYDDWVQEVKNEIN